MKKSVWIPDDAGTDMVTALRYLMGNPWAASRIDAGKWRDTEWMTATAEVNGVNGYTAALADLPGGPNWIAGDVQAALEHSPASSAFDYIIPQATWHPMKLDVVPHPPHVDYDDDDQVEAIKKYKANMTPQQNRAEKVLAHLQKHGQPFLTRDVTATVIDPETIEGNWRNLALRSWETAFAWEARYRGQREPGYATAKHMGDLERLTAAYEKSFLVGLDNALDELVATANNSPDFQASRLEIQRGPITAPPKALPNENSPGVVIAG